MGAAEDLFNSIATLADAATTAAQTVEQLHYEVKERRTGTGKLNDVQHPGDGDVRKHVGRALSAFANSDGGVLVIGIENTTKALKPFAGLREFDESVQQLFSRLVTPAVPGVITKRIETTAGSDEGVLLILIPQSEAGPHAVDRGYYFRTGDTFKPMEHYQVADAFGRRYHPKLRGLLRVLPGGNNDIHLYLGIENHGRAIAKFPMLQVLKTNPLGENGYTFRVDSIAMTHTPGLPKRSGPDGRVSIYVGTVNHVIHSEHHIDVVAFEARIPHGPVDGVAFSADVIVAAEGAPPRVSHVQVTNAQVQANLTLKEPLVFPGT